MVSRRVGKTSYMVEKLKHRKSLLPLLFLLPSFLLLSFYVVYPLAYNLYVSLTVNGVFGIQNYSRLFSDPFFHNSIVVTLKWTALTITATFFYGLVTALALNRAFRGKGFIVFFVIFPFFIPEFVSAINFMWLYDSSFGLFNEILKTLGLIERNIAWLADINAVLYAIGLSYVWRISPFVSLNLMAGLANMRKDLLDAAEVDGANIWQRFRHITVYELWPTITSVLIFLTMGGLGTFTRIHIMTGGGPARASEALTLYIYDSTFRFFDFERGAASSCVLFFLSLAITATNFYLLRTRRGAAT